MRAAAGGVLGAWICLLSQAQDSKLSWSFIDGEIERRIQESNLSPAGEATDFEFLRRAHLDLTGRLPKPEAAFAWLQSTGAARRARLIDTLLDSPEFADFWADVWLRALLGFDVFNFFRQDMDYGKLREWLRDQMAKNRPYNEMVHELITAQGEFKENGAVNFLVGYIKQDTKQPTEAAVAVSRVFLGYQLQCAQCHNHPFDKWTKEDFWGYTALFGRTKQKITNTFDGLKVKLIEKDSGELKTDTGEVAPRMLDGSAPADGSRREALAQWILGNRQFARATVNRLWAHFFGRGIVDPVDRFCDANPPSHPELLEKLADAFIASGYDLRALIRALANSKAYQRTSWGENKDGLYTRQKVRPMHPVALLNSLLQGLGAEEFMKGEEFKKNRYYLYYFIQALMGQNAKSDRASYEGAAQQALVFMNNKDFANAIHAPGGIVDIILSKSKTPRERIQSIFFVLLTRAPNEAELKRYEAYLKEKKDSREAYQDIYWVLLNANEFFFNH